MADLEAELAVSRLSHAVSEWAHRLPAIAARFARLAGVARE